MKNIIILSFLQILYIGCSILSEPVTNIDSCQDIQKEIDILEKEKYTNMAIKTMAVLGDGLYPKTEIENIDQKIKILKLKLSDCK